MAVKVADATLEHYEASNSGSTADNTVPETDIEVLNINTRLQQLIDTGRIVINNDRGQYSGTITSGDRLRLLTQLEDESSLNHRWTGVARPIEYNRNGGLTGKVEIRVDDFVFGVMDMRSVNNGFEETQIAGTSDSILETILSNNASEIGRSKIETVSDKTTVIWNNQSLLEAARDLADRGDAIVGGRDTDIIFKPLEDVSQEFELAQKDKLDHSVRENDDQLINSVRVEGGENDAVDDEQTTQSSTATVTSTSRLTHQLSTRKSELSRIRVWIQKTGSGESVKARLQKDDGGSPINTSSYESDIAAKSLPASVIVSQTYNTFLLPKHTLPEPNPWLIIESEGTTGQKIGTDGNGTPTYKAFYPYPLDTIAKNTDSIDEYRLREQPIPARKMQSRDEVNDVAKAAIRHGNKPRRFIDFPADSPRAARLKPGDIVGVDEPLDNFGNVDAIVMEANYEYRGADLDVSITAQDVETV